MNIIHIVPITKNLCQVDTRMDIQANVAAIVTYLLLFHRTCVCKTCDLRLDIPHLKVVMTPRQAILSCADGYLLVGREVISCTNGTFDGEWPTCKEQVTPCSIPGSITNGGMVSKKGVTSYYCFSNYILVGNRILNCTDGRWDGEKPTCVRPLPTRHMPIYTTTAIPETTNVSVFTTTREITPRQGGVSVSMSTYPAGRDESVATSTYPAGRDDSVATSTYPAGRDESVATSTYPAGRDEGRDETVVMGTHPADRDERINIPVIVASVVAGVVIVAVVVVLVVVVLRRVWRTPESKVKDRQSPNEEAPNDTSARSLIPLQNHSTAGNVTTEPHSSTLPGPRYENSDIYHHYETITDDYEALTGRQEDSNMYTELQT